MSVRWEPTDWIVLLLTVCIVIGVARNGLLGPPVDNVENAENARMIVLAVVAIISLYVGARLTTNNDDPP